ncbi:DUF58 domain-containing protein [Chengkuizengella sediminis]|uniref:DUF58 domain-containing protein n=1 Tax=Chengkuizengella sediminis TaxID=1885917 RepID=UPI00138A6965|nr:DUF58 domain-containing protein [Chengkuizengella sediminis]NDI34998.1 DUF58 domain-containing protein [Chengkuizengella sediminis]
MNNLKMIFVLLIWTSSLSYSWFKGGYSAWFVSYSLSLLLFYLIIVRLANPKMKTQRTISSETWISGENISVKMNIQLQTWLPFVWIVVEDEWHKQTYFPRLQSTVQYEYFIVNCQRGKYESKGLQIIIKDLFGFIRKKVKIDSELQFIVYPEPIPIVKWRNVQSESEDSNQTSSQRSYESLQFSGIRDYSYGDPMNRIHWKMSAKSNKLKTKEREFSHDYKMMLFLDANKNADHLDSSCFETAVQVAASLLRYGKNQRIGLGLTSNNLEQYKEPLTSSFKMQQAYEFLATVIPNGKISFHETMRQQMMGIQKDVMNVCITSNLDDQLINTCLFLRKQMRKINIVFIYGSAVLNIQQRKYIKSLEEMGCRIEPVNSRHSHSKIKQGGLQHGA